MATGKPPWHGLCSYCMDWHDLRVTCPGYIEAQRRREAEHKHRLHRAAPAAELAEREAMMEVGDA